MINFINNVGKSLPSLINHGSSYMYKKNVLYKIWYGRYDAKSNVWVKLKLIKDNG